MSISKYEMKVLRAITAANTSMGGVAPAHVFSKYSTKRDLNALRNLINNGVGDVIHAEGTCASSFLFVARRDVRDFLATDEYAAFDITHDLKLVKDIPM